MSFKKLEQKIIDSYTNGVSLDVAEKLAAEFLTAQIQVSSELKTADLNSRMRKQGVKAIRAALYTQARSGAEKMTEAAITAQLDANELVAGEQEAFDKAEVERDELERYYAIFREAHIYYRGIAKSSMS